VTSRGHLLAPGATTIWSTSFVVSQIGLRHMGPITVVACQYVIAFTVWLLSAIQRGVPGRQVALVTGFSSLGTFALFPIGLALAPVAADRLGTGPVFALSVVWAAAVAGRLAAQRAIRTFRVEPSAIPAPAGQLPGEEERLGSMEVDGAIHPN
jgi:EamA-like transporter family